MTKQFGEKKLVNPPRRRFVQGLAAGGTLAALGTWHHPLWAQNASVVQDPVLQGTDFHLVIGKTAVNYTGKNRVATTVNGTVPGPILRWKEGSTVIIKVENRLEEETSIHWHGILLPFEMDGVPGFSFPGIAPGESFTYRFKVAQSGTYWYHSHSRFQEQTGLYGAIVVDPEHGETVAYDRNYVVLLSDWTDREPHWIFTRLKQSSDFFNYQMPTVGDFATDVREMGLAKAWQKRQMWDQMRMNPTDLGDVSGAAFTYLTNGSTPNGNWTALARRGERVRLRFINGSATTIFDVRIPGIKMTVISADGQPVAPVSVDEFRISVAETYDVIVEMPDDQAYTIFSQSIDRSGFTRATLAPRLGMSAAVPEMGSKTWLSMVDMGMGDMHGMEGHDMSTMQNQGAQTPSMQGGQAGAAGAMSGMKGHDMASMGTMQHGGEHGAMHGTPGHDMSSMKSQSGKPAPMHSMPGMAGHDMSTMNDSGKAGAMAGHDMGAMDAGKNMKGLTTEPGVDSRVMSPSKSLSDPGPRLRDNGRRVLTYADLTTVGVPIDPREPGREIVLRLTGNMQRFVWSFDGVKFHDAEPIYLKYGERVRITLINDTMMNHPIHLHGMWSDMESEEGRFKVRKHTVNVQPSKQISFRVTADAIGQWAFHCHLLYHMEAGMFRKVVVA